MRQGRTQQDYEREVRSWDWDGMKNDAVLTQDEEGNFILCAYLGDMVSLAPSHKYYTPFACSNVTPEGAEADENFWDAVESVADEYGAWIEYGMGDGLDVHICWEPEVDDSNIDPQDVTDAYFADYKQSAIYRPGDEPLTLDGGVDSLGGVYMALEVWRPGYGSIQLPFYYNQQPDADERWSADNTPMAWANAMLGATNWSEWFDNADVD